MHIALNRGEITSSRTSDETTIRVVRNQLCVYYTYDKQGSNTPAAAGWVGTQECHRKPSAPFVHSTKPGVVTVPFTNKDIAIGTLRSICSLLWQAGWDWRTRR